MYMVKKILVVDDDPSILITLRELFENNGFEVYAVSNGKDCIDELKHGFEGVILLDLMMPVMNGIETIRHIIKNDLLKDNVISVLTAIDEPDPEYREFKKYIRDYISKPFDSEKLIFRINGYYTT